MAYKDQHKCRVDFAWDLRVANTTNSSESKHKDIVTFNNSYDDFLILTNKLAEIIQRPPFSIYLELYTNLFKVGL